MKETKSRAISNWDTTNPIQASVIVSTSDPTKNGLVIVNPDWSKILWWHIIQDEWISLTQRTKLNFIGSWVVASDNAWTWTTDITITWVWTWDWQFNGNTIWSKKTLGSIDNYDIGFITNNTERLTITNGWLSTFTGSVTSPNFISNIAVGTSPYACTSTTLNTNLNADLLDWLHSSAFQVAGSYESPLTFSTWLTRAVDTITSNISTGIAGSQSIYGWTWASETLTIYSTSHWTKGKILFGTSAYDEVNNRLWIGTTSPTAALHLKAWTATANTAPLKLTSWVLNTISEIGAIEFLTDDYYAGITTITYTSQYPTAQNDTYVKATSTYDANFYPYYATDPTKLVTWGYTGNAWLSGNGNTTNQRFHIDLGSAKTITRVYYENWHTWWTGTNRWLKNFTLWGSNTAGDFADLTYANNWTRVQLTTNISQFVEHIASDIADPKYILVTNTTPYRYYAFKIADNRGGTAFMDVRRLELQTESYRKPFVFTDWTNLTTNYLPCAYTNWRLINTTMYYDIVNSRFWVWTTVPTWKFHVYDASGWWNKWIVLWCGSAGGYAPMDFYTPSGMLGQFLATGSTFVNWNFVGNELVLAAELTTSWVHLAAIWSSWWLKFTVWWLTSGYERARFIANGNFWLWLTSPTALLHIKAGTATAWTAPLKFTSWTNMTNAEAGAMEFTTDDLFFTITTWPARKNITLWDTLGTSWRIPYNTTNGRLKDDASLTYSSTTGLWITTPINYNWGGTWWSWDTGTYLRFMPFQWSWYKKFMVYLNGFSWTAELTFPTAFTKTYYYWDATAAVWAISTTSITVSSDWARTWYIFVEWY